MGTIVNTYLQINPIQKLTLRTQFGANAHFRRTDKFTPEFYIDALEQSTLSNVSREMQEWLDWNWTNTATYITTFAEKHNINVMGGFTAERFAEFQQKPHVTMCLIIWSNAGSKCPVHKSKSLKVKLLTAH